MTKELLEQYPDICRELEEFPKHRLLCCQFPEHQEILQAQKLEIEYFVENLPTSRQRRVVMFRAMQGLTWPQVAGKMGYSGSVNKVKHLYYDVIKNFC